MMLSRTGENDPLPSCRGRPGCKECTHRFSVDPVTHADNRGFTHDKKEHGGSMWIDFADSTVHNSNVGQGRYNRIEMERGVVDWHSHPGRCLNDNMCALGLPSPQDVNNVIVGSLWGTKVHLVYAKEGTYLIRIKPALLKQMANDRSFRKMKQQEIYNVLEDLHKFFITHPSLTYTAYRRKWVKKARSLGVLVNFFAKNRRPTFDLSYDCAAAKCERMLPSVDVPPNEEELPKRTKAARAAASMVRRRRTAAGLRKRNRAAATTNRRRRTRTRTGMLRKKGGTR